MNYKDLLGIITIVIAFISYSFYFRDIFKNITKPHGFSWFIWGLLMGISFLTQFSNNAGPGAWVTGFTALICFIISGIAFKRGLRNIKFLDWISLVGAFLALFIWIIEKNPVLSVILVTITYALGFFPTFRKSISRPQDETPITFFLNGLKFLLAIFALNNISFITAFYPASLVVLNWMFVVVVIMRNKLRK